MRQVRVRYFAAFREAVGADAEDVSTAAATAGDLFAELARRHRQLAHEPASLVAINDAMARWDTPIRAGDEVLFFPPVAGG